MTDAIELSCELNVPVSRAWSAFTEPAELARWFSPEVNEIDLRPGGRYSTSISGIGEFGGVIQTVEDARLLSWIEEPRYLPAATQISVAFVCGNGGTHVTISHSGFGTGPDWAGLRDTHELGWTNHLANLQLYLLTGVPMAREISWRADFGALISDAPAAPVILAVGPGSCAEQAGLRPGDLVIKLAGAPVFRLSDIWFAVREHAHGTTVEVSFIRNGSIMAGRGLLGQP
jgi:uncharacterized protein YndB with AHSA1/START domain